LVGGDEVFVVLGDTIAEFDMKEVLDSPFSMLGVRKVDDPRDFGVAELDEDGMINHVVENHRCQKATRPL
jgi:glucose-1-phosphate thymidylyltransferase